MATVEELTIALTPDMAEFVRDAVESGQYGSTSEAVGEALREWKERRENLGYTIEELRALVQEGIDSGPGVDAAEVFADIRGKLRAIAAERA